MTCEEKMRLGWKTLQECHEQWATSGAVFLIGFVILIIIFCLIEGRLR